VNVFFSGASSEIIREQVSHYGISDDSDWAMKTSCASRGVYVHGNQSPECNIEEGSLWKFADF